MLTLSESTQVLAAINNHHGNAPIDEQRARMFHAELIDMTPTEAMDAVIAWHRDHEGDAWMGAGDLNAQVRRTRRRNAPSQLQINRECDSLNLDHEQRWLYERARKTGHAMSEAARIATRPLDRPLFAPKGDTGTRALPARHATTGPTPLSSLANQIGGTR